MKPLLIGIVGNRNTGKTTFTLKISQSLGDRRKRISVIKFSSSHYSLDPEGKDSSLYRNTNANPIIFASPFETVTYEKRTERSSLQNLLKLIPETTDLILCESYPAMLPQIPLIFIVKSQQDFEELYQRYNYQEPILIIKSPLIQKEKLLQVADYFSFDEKEDLTKISQIILDLCS